VFGWQIAIRDTALSDQLVQLAVRVDEMDATRPTKRVVAPPEDVASYFGYLSWAASLDNPTSSALTQKLLGRHPTHPGLVEDLHEGHYFQI
jgi:hypothetical protein